MATMSDAASILRKDDTRYRIVVQWHSEQLVRNDNAAAMADFIAHSMKGLRPPANIWDLLTTDTNHRIRLDNLPYKIRQIDPSSFIISSLNAESTSPDECAPGA